MSAASSHHLLRNQIADIPISQLAAKVNTPFYVYDEQKIIERINDLKAFDVVRYAQKACSNLAILDICRRNGAVVDAVSTGEILRAEAVGFSASGDPSPIVYTADIFDLSSLELVLDRGIHTNCGSPDMLTQLGQKAPGRSITLRINPGFGHGHNQKTNTGGSQSKHGIWHSELTDCLRLAEKYNLRVTGLHMHIGSGTDLEHLAQVVTAMEQAAREVGSSLDTISAGGGLPIPYQTEESYVDLKAYFQLWDAARKRLESQFHRHIILVIKLN